ncbi:hypothetical protein [uncultured Propionivibrio sp.]|uniref:hypothetical protein n=1 Tax=uncultured Propionivibrio sp. TaxID=426737 RepID=UPI0029C0D304|nr:hypothetical protein [uncultured Propionivibrio sp.]
MAIELPTRQKNILRNLLDRPEISPADVAPLDYRVVERAAGVGRHSLDIIRAWLQAHGLDLTNAPGCQPPPAIPRRQRKLQRAIHYLEEQGYEVRRTR